MTNFATTNNGRVSMLLQEIALPIPQEILRRLMRLDGTDWYALSLWAVPEGKELDQLPKNWPYEYMQTAGSATGMTVETRTNVNGVFVQNVVGRDVGSKPQRSVSIAWDQFTVPVFENEVLTAAEAAEIFVSYYRGEPLPAGYTLRPR